MVCVCYEYTYDNTSVEVDVNVGAAIQLLPRQPCVSHARGLKTPAVKPSEVRSEKRGGRGRTMVTNGGQLILSALLFPPLPRPSFHTNLTAPSTFFYDRSNCAAENLFTAWLSSPVQLVASIRLRTLSSMARRGPLGLIPPSLVRPIIGS